MTAGDRVVITGADVGFEEFDGTFAITKDDNTIIFDVFDGFGRILDVFECVLKMFGHFLELRFCLCALWFFVSALRVPSAVTRLTVDRRSE